MLGCCNYVSQVGITISDYDRQVGHRAKFFEASWWRWTSLGITMQSLGSTPLLPLIKRAPKWKIHLALFDVCFPTGTLFTLTCPFHSSASVCLFTSYTVLFIDTVLKKNELVMVRIRLYWVLPVGIKSISTACSPHKCLHFWKGSTVETSFNQQRSLLLGPESSKKRLF